MAQAGGKQADKLPEALKQLAKLLKITDVKGNKAGTWKYTIGGWL